MQAFFLIFFVFTYVSSPSSSLIMPVDVLLAGSLVMVLSLIRITHRPCNSTYYKTSLSDVQPYIPHFLLNPPHLSSSLAAASFPWRERAADRPSQSTSLSSSSFFSSFSSSLVMGFASSFPVVPLRTLHTYFATRVPSSTPQWAQWWEVGENHTLGSPSLPGPLWITYLLTGPTTNAHLHCTLFYKIIFLNSSILFHRLSILQVPVILSQWWTESPSAWRTSGSNIGIPDFII